MKNFDLKAWNSEVFADYSRKIADPEKTRLIDSGVFYGDPDLALRFPAQVGGNYAIRPITGLLSGDAVALDGATNISDGSLNTYTQGIVVIERGKAFTEKDFTYSLTGKDWMMQVADQLAVYWKKQNQKTMLAILKGIFGSALASSLITKSSVSATDINDAVRGIGGDNAEAFSVIYMHSEIARQLENLQLLEYAKYTDANGIERKTNIAYWGARLVIVDDACPVDVVATTFKQTTDVAIVAGKLYFTKSGDVYTKVANPVVTDIASYYEIDALGHTDYTTYILGANAFCNQELPVLVPYEMERDAKVNGGQTSLVSRERYILAPEGVSFKESALSSTNKVDNTLLSTAGSWELVKDASGNAIDKKVVPFCGIVYSFDEQF